MKDEEKFVIAALIKRIEELDNPSDEGIRSHDETVEAARKLLE